jgi:threonine dehydrogenase-like Zn-dependent dehydrogenase
VLAFAVHNKKLVMKERSLPKLRMGWALVRVRLAGICNTDIEILRGYHDFRGTPGHEFVGEVAKVHGISARERARWLGRRIVGEINVSCSAYGYRPVCAFCRRGLKTHCARRTVLGIVGHDGAFADYLALPLENLQSVPDLISDEQAVFVELAGRRVRNSRSDRPQQIPRSCHSRRRQARSTHCTRFADKAAASGYVR